MSIENHATIARLTLRNVIDRAYTRHRQELAEDFALLRRRLLRRMRRDMLFAKHRTQAPGSPRSHDRHAR